MTTKTKKKPLHLSIIVDKLFYPEGDLLFDELSTDDSDDVFDEIVADAEEALANEPEINGVRSLNFR